VSGWILDPDRKKMSKSKGNVVTPMSLLDQYTADGARYWAASARLGVDTAFDENVWKIGKRLVTKLFNAGKFVLGQTAEVHPISAELDRAFVAKLAALVSQATRSYDEWNYAHALQETESFFWSHFTDTYLELSKPRARSEDPDQAAARGSAVAALRLGLSVVLRLFAPVLPYITEEVWSWAFAEETGHPSIHRAPWPGEVDFAQIAAPEDAASFDVAVAALTAINKSKADAEVSMARDILSLSLAAHPDTLACLEGVLSDVLAATHCQSHRLEGREDLEPATFEVSDAQFAPKTQKDATPRE
jgi:valyl-tRNA synthetase